MSLRMKIEIIILCVVTISAIAFYLYNNAQINSMKKELQKTEEKLNESTETINNLSNAISSLQLELNYRNQELAFRVSEIESLTKLQEETNRINKQTHDLEFAIQEATQHDTVLYDWYKQELPNTLTDIFNDPLFGLCTK